MKEKKKKTFRQKIYRPTNRIDHLKRNKTQSPLQIAKTVTWRYYKLLLSLTVPKQPEKPKQAQHKIKKNPAHSDLLHLSHTHKHENQKQKQLID